MVLEKKAFLFDFDGTLADTMEDNFRAWKKACLEFNIKIKKEDYFLLEGMKLSDVAKEILKKNNIGENSEFLDILVSKKNEYYSKIAKFKVYKGVNELISELKKRDIKLAIVTASPREKLEKTVPIKFLNQFDCIISGDDVINGKPDPESYLKAIEKLKIKTNEAIIIENAPLGIEAAKNANIYCIAVCSTLTKEHLNKANKIVENIESIKRIIIT